MPVEGVAEAGALDVIAVTIAKIIRAVAEKIVVVVVAEEIFAVVVTLAR